MMKRRLAMAGACALWAAAAGAQPAGAPPVRARRFGAMVVTVCPGDPPAELWHQRIAEEFNDRTFTLYERSAATAAIHADLRIVLRAARCAEGAEVYELFMSDGRGEGVQATMLRMEGVPRDDRPQVAAVRVAEVFRTHRGELVPPEPLALVRAADPVPRERRVAEEAGLDVEIGVGARLVPSSVLVISGVQIGLGVRPSAGSRHRPSLDVGFGVGMTPRSPLAMLRTWLALGWRVAVWRSARAELALGARLELAGAMTNGLTFPTVVVGAIAEGSVRLSATVALWSRLDVGGFALGAQRVRSTASGTQVSGVTNLTEGFTAALSAGVRFTPGGAR